ncbi:MAG: hypothetical protein Q9169_000865 [Polycauliona sp. 2 TL-2023]
MAHPYTPFGGYAKLPRYQYATFNPHSFQYSHVPLYAPPPDPPPFEPPADHPVEKDDHAVDHDEAEDPLAQASASPAGEEDYDEEDVVTIEAPETAPLDEPLDEAPTAEPLLDVDTPSADQQTEESIEDSGEPDSISNVTPVEPSLDDAPGGDNNNGPIEVDYPPIEPGGFEEDTIGGEPVVNESADEVPQAEAIEPPGPTPEPSSNAVPVEDTPPITGEPADDKTEKKSKKSNKAKEKESKSKAKAKEKEKEREREKAKEAEREKNKAREKDKEKARSNGKKKKGKAKVDAVPVPTDEPAPSPEESCPHDVADVGPQPEPVADPPSETTADPPTEIPSDPSAETPTMPIVDTEKLQSEGALADAEQESPTEKPAEPDQALKSEDEANEVIDAHTEDVPPVEAMAAQSHEEIFDDPSVPDTQETQPPETVSSEVTTSNDVGEAIQPSTDKKEASIEPPITNEDVGVDGAPSARSDTSPPSVPAAGQVVEMIEGPVTEETLEASPTETAKDPMPLGEEKIEVIEPSSKNEESKIEEQPVEVPSLEAVVTTEEAPAPVTNQEATQSEIPDESRPENIEADDLKSDDQPVDTPEAEPSEATPQEVQLDGPTEALPDATIADEDKAEAIQPPIESGDAKADEQPINITEDEVAMVDAETSDKAVEGQIEPNAAASELVLESVPDAKDGMEAKPLEDNIQEQPTTDEPLTEVIPAADAEKAVENAPAEEPPPVEQNAAVEVPPDAPGVVATLDQEPVEQVNVEPVPSEPPPIEEPNGEPMAETAPVGDAPASPTSERHRKKKVAGWERQRRYSKTSTAGSDLSGSTMKTKPSSDKPPSEPTTTKHKRHSSRRTFELDFSGKGADIDISERPKISRSSTSRRSHRKDREHEQPAARPRIMERVKTEADGRIQYRVGDIPSERSSRKKGEESSRREHRRDKHRDGDRHREREPEREKQREKEREKEKEEARERERRKEKKMQEEEDERRERRRRRREEEDRKSKDGEGGEKHHRRRGEHDRERRRRGSSPPPAMKIGKTLGSGLRRLLAI